MLDHLCPCCGRHCYLDNPQCERGCEYARTGIIPPRIQKDDKDKGKRKPSEHKKRYHTLDQDNKLIWNIRDMGQVIRELSEGKGSQSRILIILNKVEVITQRALTDRLGIQPGTASEVIAKLEAAGLIVRTQNAEDKRTSDICLTEIGKIKAEEAAEKRRERHTEMFSALKDEDKENLLMLLEKLNHNWRHRYGQDK